MKAYLILLLLSLFTNTAWPADPPLTLYDEGVKKGVVFKIDCTGVGVTCTKTGTTATVDVAGGGPGGSPGGSSPQLQFNNGGSFDGVSGSGADTNGNIGIGTTGPTQKLQVVGTISATTLTGANVTSGADPGHTHTSTSVSGIDVSADTNLTGGRSLTLTDDDVLADVELYTRTFCYRLPTTPVAADDDKSIWINDSANGFTVTKLWCESDQTVTMMLQVDDGTPADMDTVDLVCISTPDTDTSLDGDATIAAGDRVDLDVASITSAPTWAVICWTGTYDD